MTAYRTKAIKDGEDTIVLIPEEIAFGDDVELVVQRVGDYVLIHLASDYDAASSKVGSRTEPLLATERSESDDEGAYGKTKT